MEEGGVEEAIKCLREGKIVLVYDADGREEETDLAMASQYVNPRAIRTMRRDGGGLICVTVHPKVRERLGLPYLSDVFLKMGEEYPVLRKLIPNDIPYDEKSAFGITINQRRTFTGVTDRDRALTISSFADLCSRALQFTNGWAQEAFGREFRSPGHVYLLNASGPLLKTRRGHTELATALVVMAGLIPTATICEMMDDNDRALSKEKAKKYAHRHNLPFLEGKEIIEAWNRWSGSWPRGSSTSST